MLTHRFPQDPGVGSIGQKSTFFSTVMLHIKLKGMTNAVTCKQIFCLYIVRFRLFHVLVLANNKWDLVDTQSNLHRHADWYAISLFTCSKVSLFASSPICYVFFLSLFACKHARNGASNTKFVMAPIHWSSLNGVTRTLKFYGHQMETIGSSNDSLQLHPFSNGNFS